jgi:hypothetical protein
MRRALFAEEIETFQGLYSYRSIEIMVGSLSTLIDWKKKSRGRHTPEMPGTANFFLAHVESAKICRSKIFRADIDIRLRGWQERRKQTSGRIVNVRQG